MNHDERVTYTEMALQHDLENLGRIFLLSEDEWKAKFLSRDDVDPLNVHKPYGVVAPQAMNGQMLMGFSPAYIVKPMDDRDDDDLSDWIAYWKVHVSLHIVVMDQIVKSGVDLTLEEIEDRVDGEMKSQGRDLWAFGEQIKLLTPL